MTLGKKGGFLLLVKNYTFNYVPVFSASQSPESTLTDACCHYTFRYKICHVAFL